MIHHTYELVGDLADDVAIDIHEDRGEVHYRLNDNLNPQQIIAALNTGAEAVLSGGHWFQEWHGDIIGRRGTKTPSRIITRQRSTVHGTGEYGAA